MALLMMSPGNASSQLPSMEVLHMYLRQRISLVISLSGLIMIAN
jgi:hypothetical protein